MTSRLFDAFDLPEWVGTQAVTWRSEAPLDSGYRIVGELRGDGDHRLPFDLLAADTAYPTVVCSDLERHDAHQAWQFGEVVLLEIDARVCAAVPARLFDANLACEAMRRVARAVGADLSRFWVSLSL
jgi:hypothetical protein